MSKRDYNVFFNTHTVSGIVISIGLYVVFLAGAFALFMDNIDHWEVNEPHGSEASVDYDQILAELAAEGYNMHGRDFMIGGHDAELTISSRPLRDTTLVTNALSILPDSIANGPIKKEIGADSHLISQKDHSKTATAELGHFLFDLHYFNQIPFVGIWLSGLVALFFLFAIISGLIIHWDKIITHFFTFRLKASLKNIWTNVHTTLGVIGLPYQLMYAITGAIFGMVMLVFVPFAKVMYGGNQQVMLKNVFPSAALMSYPSEGFAATAVSINSLVEATTSQIATDANTYTGVSIKNYQDKNAHLVVNIINDQTTSFFNTVERDYLLADGSLFAEKTANDLPPYAVAMVEFLHKIHFGQYGGYFVKTIYFLLALLTCLIIISGVMIWLKARDNKKYAEKERFNANVGAIYLGACLGLYPAIALLFVLCKTFPDGIENRFKIISWLFLAFWVGYTVYAFVIKDLFKINKHALILGGVLGLLIPVANGLHSGLWFWKSLGLGYPDSFFVDLCWLLSGALTLWIGLKIKPKITAEAETTAPKAEKKTSQLSTKSQAYKPKVKALS